MPETPRLRLLPWEPKDWLALRELANDPDVMRYISDGSPWTDQQVQEFVGRQIDNFRARGFCYWRLEHKANREFIGFCGIQPRVIGGANEIEIGWWLANAYWGKGLATEAARAVLGDAVERFGFLRIVAVAHPENARSIRIMNKLGMTYERDTIHKGFRVVVYSIPAQAAASGGVE